MLFQKTGKYIIIGLTGRTGSGCSTASKILSEEIIFAPSASELYANENDSIKYRIAKSYVSQNWRPFYSIQVRSIITGVLLRLKYEEFVSLISDILDRIGVNVSEKLTAFKDQYEEAFDKVSNLEKMNEKDENERDKKGEEAIGLFLGYLPGFCDRLKDYLKENFDSESYTKLYQRVGDNIRASGLANSSDFDENKLSTIPNIIWDLIRAIKSKESDNGACITIDAIRNPFEAIYFQQRYSYFYLVSINTPNEVRLDHLRKEHKLSDQQISDLDNKEYPKKLSGKDIYISQNIQKCIELADIHINNPERNRYDSELRAQLVWYVALFLHPGLITPTAIERSMQLAYTAKLNSGCVSRQVGAVVTDSNYSVKAVGWNNTPEGQTPCILRNVKDLLFEARGIVYSKYEREDVRFQKVAKNTFNHLIDTDSLQGRNFSYCFKDIQNEVEGEKNQVHTRSLHAEENAFLQLAKYGGMGIQNGILFSTASPCELCSKKAYQLGMKKIVYIDPYPGISNDHILQVGNKIPEMTLFSGAIGAAYHKLYKPIMAYKDELEMLTGYDIKRSNEK